MQHIIRTLFVILALVVVIRPVEAQTITCEPLETEYFLLSSRWYWLDDATVVFQVWNGGNAASTTPSITQWYEYDFLTSTLRQIDDNPLDVMPENALPDAEQANTDDLNGESTHLEQHFLSNGDRLIYPREAGEESAYIYVDATTGIEIDLGITAPDNFTLQAVWSADHTQVILHMPVFGNAIFPARLIEIQGDRALVTALQDIEEFSEVGQSDAAFTIMGLSPEGQYVVIDPYVTFNISVFDLVSKTWMVLDLIPRGERVVRWLDEDSFTALTQIGVVVYHLDTLEYEVIAPLEQLGNRTLSGSLSPDADYFTGNYWTGSGSHLEACRLVG